MGKNSNCLAGMVCPECGSEGPFHVTATSTFLMHDDGTEGHGDVEYGDDAPCECPGCRQRGKVKDFCAEGSDESHG